MVEFSTKALKKPVLRAIAKDHSRSTDSLPLSPQRPVVITLSLLFPPTHTFSRGQTEISQHHDHEQDGSVRRKHARNQSSEVLYFRMLVCTEIGGAEHRKSLPHVAWRQLHSTGIRAKSLFQIQ